MRERVFFWAQEDFCRECPQAAMITRVCSFFTFVGQPEDWFREPPAEEFTFCRDSFYGYGNQHINEKGFRVIAKYAVPNILRLMIDGEAPVLKEENVRAMM